MEQNQTVIVFLAGTVLLAISSYIMHVNCYNYIVIH